ncbi:alkaline phosphatase D family protein [Krasilnikovia sp. MM14-A1259]|uniref:alkaline phosphatase D family protein n=1 Tax=Krasilnikovia sp. MM14-A1259 TaxID=3373539 RepID=UPI0038135439
MTVSTFEGLPLGPFSATAAGFDFLAGASGATVIDANPYRGTRAAQLVTTASPCYLQRAASVSVDTAGQVYGRARFRLPTMPPDATGVRLLVIADGSGAFLGDLRIINTGRIQLRDKNAVVLGTAATTYAANQWIDVGLAVLAFSTTRGQLQAVIFNGSGQVAETITSPATLDTLGAAGTIACLVGAVRSAVAGFTVVVDDVDWAKTGWPTSPTAPSILNGPWSGAVTSTGFTAVYRLSGGSTVRLVASTTLDLAAPTFSAAVAPDADGFVKLPITGLAPDTLWFYGIEADGVVLNAGRGQVRTFPRVGTAASFSVWFGSCQWTVPTDSTYAAILERFGPYGRALMGIHMGDLNYRDWGPTTTAADVVAQHLTSLGSQSMAPHLAKIPFNYLWDNHDWGGDTSDKNAAAGPIVAAQYRRVFPTYPLPASDHRGGYHSWVIGRVRFIQLDVRSYRDPQTDPDGPDKTMLGAEQKAWLKARLLDPQPVKVICGNYYWRQDSVTSGRWGSYSAEFADLNAFIKANGVRVYVIFGDRHAICADDGSAAGAYGIPQAGGAPIQQGSVAPGEPWSAGYYHTAPSTLQAFGWLDITDTGATIEIAYQGVTTLDGVTRVQMTTTFDAATPLAAVWGLPL